MSDVLGLLNLIARSRRQELSPAEQWRLEREVDASVALRTVQQMSRDFAALAEVRPGDDQLIDRSVSLALARRGRIQRRWKQKPTSAFFLGAAAMLVGVSTAFGYWGVEKVYPMVRPVESATPATSVGTSARPRVSIRAAIASATALELAIPAPTVAVSTSAVLSATNVPTVPEHIASTQGEVASSLVEVHVDSKRRGEEHLVIGVAGQPRLRSQARPVADTTRISQPGPDAAIVLFSQANAARRMGRPSEAIRCFQELQRHHPQTFEARVSRLSLGRLLLEQGDAKGALLQFARVQGALTEEGLVGQAQAYTELGRNEDAKLIWEQLNERFPGSVYAGQARDQSRGASAVGSRE